MNHRVRLNIRLARFYATAGWFALVSAGCGASVSVRNTAVPACDTTVSADQPADTVTVVVFGPIDCSHAPVPQNREERFVFSHLYQTLVTVDCRGVVRPGLARSWKRASDGWYVEIKEDAHFWDYTMVTAADVKSCFESAMHAGFPIGAVDIVDETHAIIHGRDGIPDLKLLALPVLSIRKDGPDGVPVGTGAWQIDPEALHSGAVAIQPVAAPTPLVRFLREDTADAMDIVSGSADAMITDDADVIDYASGSHAMIFPLAWDHVYALLAQRYGQALPESLCEALARDVVRKDARAGSSLLVDANRACGIRVAVDNASNRGMLLPNPEPRLVVPSDDETARLLGERIVALAAMDTTLSPDSKAVLRAIPGASIGLRLAGLKPGEFASALKSGRDLAYIVPLSWCTDFPCIVANFSDRAPWLYPNRNDLAHELDPLVETRARFILLRHRIALKDDHAGNIRLIAPGPERVR